MVVAAAELGRERSGVLRGEVLERWWRGAVDKQQQVAAGQLCLPPGRRKVKERRKDRKEEE
jgi:hypothetical protein